MDRPLRLILTRHAKSSWKDPGLDDFHRPLNRRGTRAATAIGKWLKDKGFCPAQTLCSSAVRARRTWERIAMCCPDTQGTLLDQLYLASPAKILESLRHHGHGNAILVVAHNPGMAALAHMLTDCPPDHPAFERYTTCATTVLDLSADSWRTLEPGVRGRLVAFVSPRDLE